MIYLCNPSGTINRFLSLLIVPVMLSNIEMFLLHTLETGLSIHIASNMAFVGILLFLPLFYHFSFYYPRQVMAKEYEKHMVLVYLGAVFLGIGFLLSYFVKADRELYSNLTVDQLLRRNPIFTVFFVLMFVYVCLLLVLTIRRFAKNLKMDLLDVEERNVVMILVGFIPISILLIFSYFIFLPLKAGVEIFIPLSSFFTIYFIILLLCFGYLDRKAAFRTLFMYPLSIIILLFVFGELLNNFNLRVAEIMQTTLSVVIILELFFLLMVFQFLFKIFELKVFQNTNYGEAGFHQILKKVPGDLTGIINITELDRFLKGLFIDRLKLHSFYFLTLNEESGYLETVGRDEERLIFSPEGELAGKLSNYRKIMNIQQISIAWHEGSELAELYKRNIVLVAPLFENNQLLGMCLFSDLGPARAWYPSEVEDLEIFLSSLPVVIERCNTYQKAMALEKKQATIEKIAVLNELTSGVAHEIRNPLSIISASAETIMKRDLSASEVKKYAYYIKDETERMSKLLNRILTISLNSEEKNTPVDVIEAIQASFDLVSAKLIKKRIIVKIESPPEPCIALINKDILMQVSLNLILNASDAMTDGDLLSVYAEYTEDDKVKICFSNQGDMIPENIRNKIFDPFFTTKKSGTGLGLSITQRLLKATGGSIKLADSENETVFEILLPAAVNFMR
ncbi:MAG: histidine kinase dimerization/phospho-acceptor domain-containing protein [Spirochaetales bacterium]|nr:histidine kinase dimerization/phospho-acceptor domain-containing protein [Spirochaetales bacterium]